jgi:hypothetical protein
MAWKSSATQRKQGDLTVLTHRGPFRSSPDDLSYGQIRKRSPMGSSPVQGERIDPISLELIDWATFASWIEK